VISVEAGAKIPIPDCEAAPTGLIASLEAVPTVGWLQIMLTTCMIETGVFASKSQTGGYAGINPSDGIPGDIRNVVPRAGTPPPGLEFLRRPRADASRPGGDPPQQQHPHG